MAYIGLANPIIAKLSNGTYSDAAFVGKAIGVDVTPNFSQGTLYADNGLAESDFAFTYADVTLETSTLPMAVHSTLFGSTHTEATTGESATPETLTEGTGDISNTVGVGFHVLEVIDGATQYVAFWMPKAKFTPGAESFKTKGENVEYQTPSVSGKAYGATDKTWRERAIFTTEAAALAWLKDKANMTA